MIAISLYTLAQQTNTDSGAAVPILAMLFVFLVFGAIGASMAMKRFRSQWVGFLLGGFLTWIGLIVIAVMGKKKGPPCVSCGTPLEFVSTGGRWKARPVPAHVCLACGTQQPFGAWMGQGTVPGSTATGTPSMPPPPLQPVSAWTPTHEIPAEGLAAYPAPDPATPVVANLDPRLPLQLLERRGDWARVRASNDWEGWVDARRLEAAPALVTPAPPAG